MEPLRSASLPASVSTTALSIIRMASLRSSGVANPPPGAGGSIDAPAGERLRGPTTQRGGYPLEPLGSRSHEYDDAGMCRPASRPSGMSQRLHSVRDASQPLPGRHAGVDEE